MEKKIVLARPHPFVVAEMRPFLTAGGFSISKPEHVTDLPALLAGAAGAVISLALSSPISASVQEVFEHLRQSNARLPVLFASMLDFEQALPALQRVATAAGIEAELLGVDDHHSTRLGRQETFLYFSKQDLADADRRTTASRMIRKHFR